MSRRFAPRASSRMQSGIAALFMVLMVLIFVGMLAASFILQRKQAAQVTGSQEQSDSLHRARNLLVGFAMREGRLPCLATAPGGPENCNTAQRKGWLPTGTLDPLGATTHTLGRLPVRYMVYRGTGVDLTSAITNDYIPAGADATPVPGYPIVHSTLDLCRKLYLMTAPPAATAPAAAPETASAAGGPMRWSIADGLQGTAADPAQAHVSLNGNVVNVAFGLAVAPAGTGAALSGVNADEASAEMAIPGSMARLVGDRDQVMVTDAGALHRTLGCGGVQASVDAVAMSTGWPAAAAAAKQGTINGYGVLLGLQALTATSASLGVVETVFDLLEAGESAAEAAPRAALDDPEAIASLVSLGIVVAGDIVLLVGNIGSASIELANIGVYSARLAITRDSYVWEDALPILEKADAEGVKP